MGDVVTREGLDELPHTVRGNIPYETMVTPEAGGPVEAWGPGTGFSEVVCRQRWDDSANWIRAMVGETYVATAGSTPPVPYLVRQIPEPLKYGDNRRQWCMGVRTYSVGGNRFEQAMQDPIYGWPSPDWIKYTARFETPPYAIRTKDQVADMVLEATLAGRLNRPEEMFRYMIRNRKNYVREQPIPVGAAGTGFKIVDPNPALRVEIPTAVSFKAVSYADIAYTWVRVPVGWPPPAGWIPNLNPPFWPPLVNAKLQGAHLKYARDEYLLCVNDGPFDDVDPEGYSFDTGELLYVGYDDNFKYDDAAGNRMMDVIYFFKYKKGGWNKFLDNLGNFREVSSTGITPPGGLPVYKSANFNLLFQYSSIPIV